MVKKLRLVFFCLLVFSSISYSQVFVKGWVQDTINNKFLESVYIENVSKNFITKSNLQGEFSIPASDGDTIIASSIGYLWSKVVYHKNQYITIYMNEQFYKLDEVIKRAPISYEAFKQEILAMSVPEDTINLHINYQKYYPISDYTPGQLSYHIDGALTALYESVNKHARNRIRAIELLENQHTLISINQKFNKQIVFDVTHIPESHLEAFVAFCAFSDDFLYEATEYQILGVIYSKYEEYLFLNPEIRNL